MVNNLWTNKTNLRKPRVSRLFLLFQLLLLYLGLELIWMLITF